VNLAPPPPRLPIGFVVATFVIATVVGAAVIYLGLHGQLGGPIP
jgi:hypothetical protein